MPHGCDRRATHEARVARAAVDIDLAAVPILAWSAAGKYRIVLWPYGVDSTATNSVAHQPDEIRPQLLPLIEAQLTARLERIKLVAEQHLGAVHVANPDQY